jgi:hypothetical protein
MGGIISSARRVITGTPPHNNSTRNNRVNNGYPPKPVNNGDPKTKSIYPESNNETNKETKKEQEGGSRKRSKKSKKAKKSKKTKRNRRY